MLASICKGSSDNLNDLNVEIHVSVSSTTCSCHPFLYETIISEMLVLKDVLC
jgi:hypothetical protein